MIKASAPAKVIMFGEHSVVYGEPAIAVPVSSLRAYASIEKTGSGVFVQTDLNDSAYREINLEDTDSSDPVTKMILLAIRKSAVTSPAFRLSIHSDIPPASGLGSGAAVSAAIGRAVSQLLDFSLPDAALNELVFEVEKIHHATPSGIDNTVIVYEQPLYFIRERTSETLKVQTPIMLLIGDTGKRAHTRIAVTDVRKIYESDPELVRTWLEAMGNLARDAKSSLLTGDINRLGKLMNENHHYLQKLSVSSPKLDRLCFAARESGALGAKMSGGGRGGNMIALVTEESSESVQAALLANGAKNVFRTRVQ